MVSVVDQQLDSQTAIVTNLLQQQQNYCKATTNINVENTTVVVENAKGNADITGVSINGIGADGSCIMSNSMESQVEQILRSTLAQSTKTQSDLFSMLEGLNFSVNNSKVTESIANNMTQYAQSACLADTTIKVNNTYLYVGNANNGNITGVLINNITANTSCSMSNIGKIINYLEDSKDFDQNASKSGTLGSLMGIFGIVIVLVIGVIVVMVILSLFKGKKGGEKSNNLSLDDINALLAVGDQIM